jgi:hypothetical protein
MIAIGLLFIRILCDCFKPRRQLEAEILVLRHQLNVLQQHAPPRPRLRWVDCALFISLYRRCPRILNAITIVRPETVLRWHRRGFAAYWRWKSRSHGGRPRIAKEVRDLIRRMRPENQFWGATKIHGELLKPGIRSRNRRFRSTWSRGEIGRCRPGRPSSPITWRGLRRLICLWFRPLRFNNYSHFWFSGTNGGGCYGLR